MSDWVPCQSQWFRKVWYDGWASKDVRFWCNLYITLGISHWFIGASKV